MVLHRKISLRKTFSLYLIVGAVLSIAAVGSFWILSEEKRYREESALLRQNYLDAKKETLKREVDRTLAFIEFKRSQVEARLKASIRDRVYEAQGIAMAIYHQQQPKASLPQIKETIREALRPIRYNNGRGYYFAFDLEGIVTLFADKPEMEGKSLMRVRGGLGELVVPDMLNIARKDGEGFYTYQWSKPNREGYFPKIAFFKIIEPIGWVVGTGEYLDDVEKDIQTECLQRISTIRFGEGGYVFAGQWDGFSLSGPAVGENMVGVTDANGVKIVQRLIQTAKSGGGFIQYVLPEFEKIAPGTKLSYVVGVPEWQWYIGAGVYVNALEGLIAQKQVELKKRIHLHLRIILSLLLALLAGAFIIVKLLSNRIHGDLKSFMAFFDETPAEDQAIDPASITFSEFSELADFVNGLMEMQQKEAAERWEAMKLLDAAISNSPSGILIADAPEGRIRLANPAAVSIRGGTPENLTGVDIGSYSRWQVLRPDGTPYPSEELPLARALLQGEVTQDEEAIIRHEAGEDRWVCSNAAPIRDEQGQITAGMVIFHDVTERKRAEAKSIHSEQRFRELAELLPQTVFEMDSARRLFFLNKNAYRQFGYQEEEFKDGMDALELLAPRDRKRAEENISRTLQGDTAGTGRKYMAMRKDGSEFPVLIYGGLIAADHIVSGLLGIVIDISDQEKLAEERDRFKEQYLQVQKIEAMGRLAGGIAHDLNNLLSPILGYSELLVHFSSLGEKERKPIENIHSAGLRAKAMVQQLLAFSRKQALDIHRLNVNTILTGFESLLRRMLREDIQLQMLAASDLPEILADAGQIEQVIMNIAINAQDAMPGGGKIRIETHAVNLDASYAAAHQEISPGPHVLIVISDTGHGMDAETQSHIFEPFFTTKGLGRGTGLGLSTVYGIVKQHKGSLWVYSEPGKGTVFKIYFPVAAAETPKAVPETLPAEYLHGAETVMIAEDNETVRELAVNILKRYGYRVLSAAGGGECLQQLNELAQPVDLLLTDVIMADMNGKELSQLVRVRYPGVKVLFMSGYTDEVIVHHGVLEEGIAFIEKPFSVDGLAAKVRSVLDGPSLT